MRAAFITSPLSPVYSDNNIYDSPYNDTSNSKWFKGDGNPYGLMMTNTNNRDRAQNMLANIYADLVPVKNLHVKTLFGFNYYSTDYRSYTPLYQFSIYAFNTSHTSVTQRMSKGHTMTWTNTANYNLDLTGGHHFDFLAGMEAIRYEGVGLSASNWNPRL